MHLCVCVCVCMCVCVCVYVCVEVPHRRKVKSMYYSCRKELLSSLLKLKLKLKLQQQGIQAPLQDPLGHPHSYVLNQAEMAFIKETCQLGKVLKRFPYNRKTNRVVFNFF